jgi:vacuolar-type H+-ATPase subunit H
VGELAHEAKEQAKATFPGATETAKSTFPSLHSAGHEVKVQVEDLLANPAGAPAKAMHLAHEVKEHAKATFPGVTETAKSTFPGLHNAGHEVKVKAEGMVPTEEQVTQASHDAVENVGQAVHNSVESVKQTGTNAQLTVGSAIGSAVGLAKSAVTLPLRAAHAVVDTAKGATHSVLDTAHSVVDTAKEQLSSAYEASKNVSESASESASEGMEKAQEVVSEGVSKANQTLTSASSSMGNMVAPPESIGKTSLEKDVSFNFAQAKEAAAATPVPAVVNVQVKGGELNQVTVNNVDVETKEETEAS